MTIPLVVLAILAVVGGYVGLPVVISEHHMLRDFLGMNGSVVNAHELMERVEGLGHSKEWMLIGISVAVAVIASIIGVAAHRRPAFAPNKGIALAMEKKWWVDELYDAVIVRPLMALSSLFDRVVERKGIDASVNGVGRFVRWSSDRVRLMQSGQVGYYIFIMVLGMTVLIAIGFFGNPF
jgi:NADH-quinone oxidoreductase subunit L